MTLGQALAAKVRLIVWCKACGHRAEPDIAAQIDHNGEAMTVIDLGEPSAVLRVRRSEVDFGVSGAAR